MTGGGARDRSVTTVTDDAALVEGIAKRVPAALESAYLQHGSRVHALARGLCGAECADALTEAVFLELWKNPARFEPSLGSLRSYLLVQVHRQAVESLRQRAASAADQRPIDADLVFLEASDVEAIISGLPDGERHAIVLSYFGGHTYAEVASLIGAPEGVVKTRIRNGLSRLKSQRAASVDA